MCPTLSKLFGIWSCGSQPVWPGSLGKNLPYSYHRGPSGKKWCHFKKYPNSCSILDYNPLPPQKKVLKVAQMVKWLLKNRPIWSHWLQPLRYFYCWYESPRKWLFPFIIQELWFISAFIRPQPPKPSRYSRWRPWQWFFSPWSWSWKSRIVSREHKLEHFFLRTFCRKKANKYVPWEASDAVHLISFLK